MRKIALALAVLLCCAAVYGCAAPAPAAAEPAAPAATIEPTPVPTPEPTPEPPVIQYASAQEAIGPLQSDGAILLDIQPREYYKASHYYNAVATYAYPADTDALRQSLRDVWAQIQSASGVYVADMAGKAGARNAVDFLIAEGADPAKLFILEGGMLSWPYPEWLEKDPGAVELQYLTARDVRGMLRHEEPVFILDLRGAEAYAAIHLNGAVNVPACAHEDPQNLKNALCGMTETLRTLLVPIVIVNANADSDCADAVTYFVSRGMSPTQFFVMEGGMDGWPERYNAYATLAGETQTADAQ